MYKLFLCLRYLRLRFIAYLPIAAVALSVFLMLISISVMNGFLEKIETAAKGLFGDIVVEPQTLSGIGYYDEFIKEITDPKSPNHVPGVKYGAPFILTQAILDLPGSDNRTGVQVAGVRLPRWEADANGNRRLNDFGGHVYTNVSTFAKGPSGSTGLYFQKDLAEPTFNPPWPMLEKKLEALHGETRRYYDTYTKRADDNQHTLVMIDNALMLQGLAIMRLHDAPIFERQVAELGRQIEQAKAHPTTNPGQSADELQQRLDALNDNPTVFPSDYRIILGTMVRSFRTEEGRIVRMVAPGYPVNLTIAPLGRPSATGMDYRPGTWGFTVVDDCRTDVSGIDTNTVYLPFETLQRINKMSATYAADNPREVADPARCSQIQFKADDSLSIRQLEKVAAQIQQRMDDFLKRPEHFNAMRSGADGRHPPVSVETWRTRQAQLVNQIAAQRTLVVIMFGISSLVCVVLIFAIFYMIVFQKTQDIGVIKAIGGSSTGVAGIFLAYGSAVGLVGAILGAIGGYFFVLNINPIHDWIGRTTGLIVWRREWFMFDDIPNTVHWSTVLLVAAGAILAGLIGALAPAIMAARRQPVEALRYE